MTDVPRVLDFPTSARCIPLPARRLEAAKAAYTTRNVDLRAGVQLLTGVRPEVGDLVLARVAKVGQHARLELRDSRRAIMFPGDEIVVAYGNRYAPDQFEAQMPTDLLPCDLVAAGGVASRVISAHSVMLAATRLEPIGLLANAVGDRLNLRAGVTIAATAPVGDRPLTVVVVGASMNSGKTTTAAHLICGLRLAGFTVGATKTTGTGAGGDTWFMSDAGASPVYDFTDVGYPSTYLLADDEVRSIFTALTDRVAADGCQVLVVEIADGIYQRETAGLLVDPVFAGRVDAVLFASSDALGASAGVRWLQDRGLAPIAVSGLLTASPLAMREAQLATGCPVWDIATLSDPTTATALYATLQERRAPGAELADCADGGRRRQSA